MLGRILIFGVFLLGTFSEGTAATRFVSKTGSDSYNGSSWSQAWLTISKVNSSTSAGDTVIFGTGTWRGTTLISVSGTSGNLTYYLDSLYLADGPGERVAYLYGSDSLSDWTLVSGHVYRCSHTPTSSYPTLFQDGSVLLGQSSQATVDAAGKWYYGGGYVYAWVNGGDDPDNYDMEILARQVVNMASTVGHSYISFEGLGFKYGDVRVFSNSQISRNYVRHFYLKHCILDYAAGWGGVNPSLFYTDRTTDYDTMCTDIKIVACSLGTCYSWTGPGGLAAYPQTEEASHGNSVTLYSAYGCVIESTAFFGHQSEAAIYFKCANDGVDGGASYDTVRFNTIAPTNSIPFGIRIWGGAHNITIYGNVISGASSGIHIGYFQLGFAHSYGYHTITNNTFYNCATAAVQQSDIEGRGYTYAHRYSTAKYNVIYNATALSRTLSLDSLNFWATVDSNMYYAESGTSGWRGPGTTANTWAQWRARGLDAHSTSGSDPGFDDPAYGDFSRPSAGTEMNRTYGGRTWTKYGAVQGIPSMIPRIGVSPSSLTYAATQGASNPASKTLTISNAGGGTLNWSASSGASWLSLSPGSGSGTGTVTASVSISGLSAGSFATNITMSAAGADNTPLTVPVTLTIAAPDVTGPVITGVSGTGLATSASNTIVWQTNEPATSQVAYGLTVPYGSTTVRDETLVTDHAVDLFGLTADTVYHFQVISRDALGNQTLSSDYEFRTTSLSSNLALGRPVTVSGSYAGYGVTPINDGTIAASGGASGTWASDQSASPHWVVVDLQTASVVRSVRMYWAYNTGTSKFMRSLQFIVQYWDGAGYVDLATVDNPRTDTVTYPDTTVTYDSTGAPTGYSVTVAPAGDDVTVTAAGFPSVSTSRIRIYQPANQGPESYPSIMWLTELEVYSEDIAPPSAP